MTSSNSSTPFAYSDSQALAGWVDSFFTGIYYPNGTEQKIHYATHLYEILPEDSSKPPEYWLETFDGVKYIQVETRKQVADTLIELHGI